MSGTFEQAREFFLRGLEHYQAGRFAQADAQYCASLSLVPGRVSTLVNLGATRLRLGRPKEAAAFLEEALAKEPHRADALGHLATALADLGQLEKALECVERALALDATAGPAWSLRGEVLRDLGRHAEAADSLAQAIAHGADSELTRYQLSALTGRDVPSAPPRDYVEALFDSYSDDFDQHATALQ